MSKHTPGPWNIMGSTFAYTIGANGIRIATTSNIVHEGSIGVHEEEANARLIAAAPDLFEALKELTELWAYGLAKDDAVEDSAYQRKLDMKRCEDAGRKAGVALAKAGYQPPDSPTGEAHLGQTPRLPRRKRRSANGPQISSQRRAA